MWGSSIILTLINVYLVNADLFLHCPRGSNNRLDGNKRERTINNRLFDSQNNPRGGYNVGGDAKRSTNLNTVYQGAKNVRNSPGIRAQNEERFGPLGKMKYYEGSILEISWTNQHQCGGKNAKCELVLQYMCSDNLRDGFLNQQIYNINSCEVSEDGTNSYCDTDRRFGMHEDTSYYTYCINRLRNKGLFTADQILKGKDTSIFTRQNNNGARSGYECPEERDYYPYWAPTPWIDIAVMTSDVEHCKHYKTESENVKPRYYCKIPDITMTRLRNNNGVGTINDRIPITKKECEAKTFDGVNGKWVKDTRIKHAPPECIFSPRSRDNHLGNGPNGFPNSFNWTVPNRPHKHCAIRLRYNISTDDYDRDADSSFNGAGKVNIGARIGANNTEAKKRGFIFQGNPTVKPLKIEGDTIGDKLKLQLAINTAQYGRTFQDRSHEFEILQRPRKLAGKKIYNLNVQGKRGNIVQVFPAVEYDYMPNRLEVNQNDYIHIQWTGSDNNPVDNAGNGKAGSDRSNMVLLKGKNYPEGTPGKAIARHLRNGHWGNNYLADLDDSETLLGLPRETREYLALTVHEEKKSLTTCEAETMVISCPKSMAIKITYAHFGLDDVYCINHDQSINVAQTTCEGKSDCTLAVNTQTFTDPCQGVKKCLDVRYQCMFRNKVTRLKPGEIDIGDSWTTIAGSLQQISIGDGKIIGANKQNQVFFRLGIDFSHPYGTQWKTIKGQSKFFTAGDGKLAGIDHANQVFFRTGISKTQPDGTGWKYIIGEVHLKQITVGDGKIMGVDDTDKIYFRTGVSEQQPFGNGWVTVDGNLTYITVGDGKIMGVKKDGQIFFRDGINSTMPYGTIWKKIDGRLKQIALGDGKIMGVNKDDKILVRTGVDSSHLFGTGWMTIDGSLKQIVIGDGRIMGVTSKDEVLARIGMKNIKAYNSEHGNLKDLDDVHPYFNLAPQKMTKLGEYKYMCTRNNDFSNRSQKGRITVRSTKQADAIPNATEELMGMEEMFEAATAAI